MDVILKIRCFVHLIPFKLEKPFPIQTIYGRTGPLRHESRH